MLESIWVVKVISGKASWHIFVHQHKQNVLDVIKCYFCNYEKHLCLYNVS
jgi:hypothetical protein